jgi:hypothetical protein
MILHAVWVLLRQLFDLRRRVPAALRALDGIPTDVIVRASRSTVGIVIPCEQFADFQEFKACWEQHRRLVDTGWKSNMAKPDVERVK